MYGGLRGLSSTLCKGVPLNGIKCLSSNNAGGRAGKEWSCMHMTQLCLQGSSLECAITQSNPTGDPTILQVMRAFDKVLNVRVILQLGLAHRVTGCARFQGYGVHTAFAQSPVHSWRAQLCFSCLLEMWKHSALAPDVIFPYFIQGVIMLPVWFFSSFGGQHTLASFLPFVHAAATTLCDVAAAWDVAGQGY
eukprot:1149713-Pelagomonas_calceolata.AAC.4